mmetsp:Transcript_90172/g.255578  ORF Transcript_90172/g.255578 Transcript_90172/m.255578 type:complete len:207 (-) Transcript_90172:520-1140(-)
MNNSTAELPPPPQQPPPPPAPPKAPLSAPKPDEPLDGPNLTCIFASRMRPISAELGLRQKAREPRRMTTACTCGGSERRFCDALSSSRFSAMKASTSSRPMPSPPQPPPPSVRAPIMGAPDEPHPPPDQGGSPCPPLLELVVSAPYLAWSFASRMRPISAELGLTHSASEPRSSTMRWMWVGSVRRFCAAVVSMRLKLMKASTSEP